MNKKKKNILNSFFDNEEKEEKNEIEKTTITEIVGALQENAEVSVDEKVSEELTKEKPEEVKEPVLKEKEIDKIQEPVEKVIEVKTKPEKKLTDRMKRRLGII